MSKKKKPKRKEGRVSRTIPLLGSLGPIAILDDDAYIDQAGLTQSAIEISFEPVDDPQMPQTPEEKKELIRLYYLANDDPEKAIPEILAAMEIWPHHPRLYNYLSVAYGATGQQDKLDEIAAENLKHNPNYLFARANWAGVLFSRGQFDDAGELFNYRFDLMQICPGRTKFHLTELLAVAGVAIQYYLGIDAPEPAMRLFEELERIAPGHHSTQLLGGIIGEYALRRRLNEVRRAIELLEKSQPQ